MGTKALFTKTQRHVLEIIFGNVDQSFAVTEIIKAARSGSGAVQREIAKLAEGGLITMTRVGNQKQYQANPASPIFSELRSIVMKSGAPAPSPVYERSSEPDYVD